MNNEQYENWYSQARKDLVDIFNYSQTRIDEVLLLVTIPALGVFLGCLEKIGYPKNIYMFCLMLGVVVFFLLVIFCNIISLYSTTKASYYEIKNLDYDYRNHSEEKDIEIKKIYPSGVWDKWTKRLNRAAIICFFMACISLTVFIIFSASK